MAQPSPKLLITGGKKLALPREHKAESVSLPRLSPTRLPCSLGGKNPHRRVPRPPVLIALYLPFPSPTSPDTTVKAVPMCKSSITCPGYIFTVSDFNGVIWQDHCSQLLFYSSVVAIAAKVETKHIVHQSKVSWLMVFIFLYELTLEDSRVAANGNSSVFLSPLSVPLSPPQSR